MRWNFGAPEMFRHTGEDEDRDGSGLRVFFNSPQAVNPSFSGIITSRTMTSGRSNAPSANPFFSVKGGDHLEHPFQASESFPQVRFHRR